MLGLFVMLVFPFLSVSVAAALFLRQFKRIPCQACCVSMTKKQGIPVTHMNDLSFSLSVPKGSLHTTPVPPSPEVADTTSGKYLMLCLT